jgi:predicted Fe-Mo cluster-binding NifX family protein
LPRILTLVRLKLVDLLSIRGLMLTFALLPVLLGLIAGAANAANLRPDVALAVVDLDQSGESQALTERLRQHGWAVSSQTEREAARLLYQQQVDGVITIEAGFAASMDALQPAGLRYVAAEGSLITSLVREAVAAAVLPEYSRRYMLSRIRTHYGKAGKPVPDDIDEQFRELIAAYAAGEARLKITYIGSSQPAPALTYVVTDYSMEIFFLSIYAILGVSTLSRSDLRRRLAAARHGILADYAASVAALLLVGMGQILLFTLAMRLLMQTPLRLQELSLITVYLVLMLGSGQLLSLIGQNLRLYLSLFVLLLMAIAGGCFFQLSEKLLSQIGQYTPHGWIISRLRGYPALPAAVPLVLGLLLLVFGYYLQKRRAARELVTTAWI